MQQSPKNSIAIYFHTVYNKNISTYIAGVGNKVKRLHDKTLPEWRMNIRINDAYKVKEQIRIKIIMEYTL